MFYDSYLSAQKAPPQEGTRLPQENVHQQRTQSAFPQKGQRPQETELLMAEKITTLKTNGDFRRLYARGKSYVHPVLVTYLLRNRAGINRIGITTSRKIGNAVTRNRARRVIKEAYRQLAPDLIPGRGWDIVFVARTKTSEVKSTQIKGVMRRHFKEAFLMQK